MSDESRVYTPSEAVEYLKRERGIVYSVASLRNLRRRGTAQAQRVLNSITLWSKAELDAIEPTRKTKRVEPETGEDQEEGERSSSVRILSGTLSACLAGVGV